MTTTLVIGASGQIGSHLANLLAARGQTVRRATSRAPSQPGEVQVNLATGEGLAAALAGVDQLFLMAPPGYANQHELLIPAIDAAKAAGVRKLLLLSAMGANADDSIPLRRAELHLERSGLAWNVIRPNWFMQNFHTFWLHGIQSQGQIFLPVGDAKGSFIDTRDVAAVAAGLSQIIGPLVYADTANRGFMVVTATPHECRCDWHFVSSVKTSSYSTWLGQSLKTLPGAGQRKLISA